MAYGVASNIVKRRLYVDSAGLVTRDLDPFVAQIMQEIDVDVSSHQSKTLDDITLQDFDLVIALTNQSYNHLLSLLADSDTQLEFWPTEDPSSSMGNRQMVMEGYRTVRRELDDKIKNRLKFLSVSE